MGGITYYKTTFGECESALGLVGSRLPPGDDPDLTVVMVDHVNDSLTLKNGRTLSRRAVLAKHFRDEWYVGVQDDMADATGWKPPKSWKLVKHEL